MGFMKKISKFTQINKQIRLLTFISKLLHLPPYVPSPRANMSPLILSCFYLLSFMYATSKAQARAPPISAINASSEARSHGNKWHEFEKFLDAGRGSSINGISELSKYLHKFGYLEEEDITNSNVFDSNLELAVKRYQQKLGLSITGKLDSRTLAQLMLPRCGVPDVPKKMNIGGKYAYFAGRPRWGRNIPMKLTYAFSPTNSIHNLSMKEGREAFTRSFARWSAVIPVTFAEAADYGSADIKIGFYYGDHGDGEAFDGVLGVLAHSFSPESGRFHLDAAEVWAVDFEKEKSAAAVDLESVATHEIGHLLGLAHTDVADAVMYPSLRPREKKLELKMDDVRGVQALYGKNPNFNFQTFSESDIYSSGGGGRRDGEDGLIRVRLVMLLTMALLCM